MKKLISILLVCIIMVCVNMVPVMAAEDEREKVTIEVDTLQDVREFYESPAHDPSKRYSFIIKYHPTSRMPCPNCGSAAWTGENYGVEELAPYPQQCPAGPSTNNDRAIVMFYHYLERCRGCGYEIVYDQYYFKIECQYMPGWGCKIYEAWDGQDWESGGYDIHEDKSTWYAVPARYH